MSGAGCTSDRGHAVIVSTLGTRAGFQQKLNELGLAARRRQVQRRCASCAPDIHPGAGLDQQGVEVLVAARGDDLDATLAGFDDVVGLARAVQADRAAGSEQAAREEQEGGS